MAGILGWTVLPAPFPAPGQLHVLPLSYVAIAAAAVALARGDKMDRLLLIGLGVILPAIPWALGLSFAWTVALAGAAAGGLMVRSHLCELGEEGSVASGRPGALNYALGAVLTGGLAVAGMEVARALGARLADISTPSLLLTLFGGLVMALFVSIGSLGAHLAVKPDPVEARC